jgi:hypothetical protein
MRHVQLNLMAGIVLLSSIGAAQAQVTRTWVSGTGDDANSCSRTAPCKTFAGAYSRTAAGGEINCIDPGGFGGIVISKSLTIDCGGTFGGVLVAGTNAIVINDSAAGTIIVTLRNLSIVGVSGATTGIRFTSGKILHVENVTVRGFDTQGLLFSPAAGVAAELYVSDSLFHENGGASGNGILIQPAGAGTTANVVLNRVESKNNGAGITAYGGGSTGGIRVLARDTTAVGNSVNGFTAVTTAGAASTVMFLERASATSNGGSGITSDGPGANLLLTNTTSTGNGTGLATLNGATTVSYLTNQINANFTANGTATVTQARE